MHLAILAGCLIASWLVAWFMQYKPHVRGSRAVYIGLIFICLLAYPFSIFSWAKTGSFPSIEYIVPLHFCDITVVLCGFALITRHPLLCELAYFWGIAGASQALLTPALPEGATILTTFAFFIHHWAIITVAWILLVQPSWNTARPLWLAALRPLLYANIYFVVAIIANKSLGANYGYLSHKPDTPTALDHLGPWPYYIIWMEIISYFLFFILAILLHRKSQKITTI